MMTSVGDVESGAPSKIHKCHHCDELLLIPILTGKERAMCPRCGSFIRSGKVFSYEQLFCLTLTALILLFVSLPYPFISLNANGNETVLSLLDSVHGVYLHDHPLLALTLFLSIVAIPILATGSSLLIFGMLWSRYATAVFPTVFRVFHFCTSWMMVEVFVIAVLVSLLKIASMARVELGISFYSYSLYVIFAGVILSQIDRSVLWENWLEIRNHSHPNPGSRFQSGSQPQPH